MIILSELWSKSLDILRVLRYCVSLIGGDTRERLYAGAAPAVLPGTGVCGRVGRDRGSPAGTAGAAGPAAQSSSGQKQTKRTPQAEIMPPTVGEYVHTHNRLQTSHLVCSLAINTGFQFAPI